MERVFVSLVRGGRGSHSRSEAGDFRGKFVHLPGTGRKALIKVSPARLLHDHGLDEGAS